MGIASWLDFSMADWMADSRCCRICFASAEESLQPLICPCACVGSMGFVHSECLVEWLRTRPQHSQTPRCEICREPLRVRTLGVRGFLDSNFDGVGLFFAFLAVGCDIPFLLN